MTRAALIDSARPLANVVTVAVYASPEAATADGAIPLPQDSPVAMGWTLDCGVEPRVWHPPAPPPSPEFVPRIVTPLQARLALAAAGLLADIEAAVAEMEPTDPSRLAWEWASQFDESSPLLIAMCEALGVTPEQRAALFDLASGIEV